MTIPIISEILLREESRLDQNFIQETSSWRRCCDYRKTGWFWFRKYDWCLYQTVSELLFPNDFDFSVLVQRPRSDTSLRHFLLWDTFWWWLIQSYGATPRRQWTIILRGRTFCKSRFCCCEHLLRVSSSVLPFYRRICLDGVDLKSGRTIVYRKKGLLGSYGASADDYSTFFFSECGNGCASVTP